MKKGSFTPVDPDIQARIALLAELCGGATALSRVLQIHRSTVFDFLGGVRGVPPLRLRLIAEMIGCSLAWLAYGEGEPPKASDITLLPNLPRRKRRSDCQRPDLLPPPIASPAPGNALLISFPTDMTQEEVDTIVRVISSFPKVNIVGTMFRPGA